MLSSCHSIGSWYSFLHATYAILSEVWSSLNLSPLGQNGRHFTDDIYRWICFTENIFILIKISLKFVPKGPVDNNPALVQIMACHQIGDKPLSESMLTHFTSGSTRERWVNDLPSNTMFCCLPSIFVLIMAFDLCPTHVTLEGVNPCYLLSSAISNASATG